MLQNCLNEIYLLNTDTLLFEYVNDDALRNLGYSLGEMKQKTLLNIEPEITVESFKTLVHPLIQKEKEKIIFETVHQRANSILYPVEVHLQVLECENQCFFLAVVQDLTGREKVTAEAESLKSNEWLMLLSKATNDMVWDWDMENNTIWENHINYKLSGLDTAKDTFSLDAWKARIHPDDRERVVNGIYQTILSQNNDSWQADYRRQLPDGSYGYFYDRGYLLRNSNGKPVRMIGSSIHLTEIKRAAEKLKQSEEQYHQLFNLTPLPAWIVDNETQNYLAVNDAAIKHYGYSREEFLTMNVKDLQPASELERSYNKNSHVTDPYDGNIGIWKHQKKDGSIIVVEIVSHEIMYKNKPARLALTSDITKKLKLEEEMKRANEELRDHSKHLQNVQEEERIQIARDIHDDLSQQLTGLKMEVYWLNKKLKPEDEAIRKKIEAISELIDEVVKSSRRISSNLRPEILDDLGLIAALEWHSQEVDKSSEVIVTFTSNMPEIEVPADIKTGLFRIYQEMLANAVRHAHAHSINSKLQMKENFITLEVKDDGQGFEPETGEIKMFGLLGIKERTYALGGKFELTSKTGQGTTVRVSVPL